MKTCCRCRETKPLDEFHRYRRSRDGRRDYCKTCFRVMRRGWRGAQNEARRRWQNSPENRAKREAHKAVENAIKRGELVRPTACEQCDGTPVQAHHSDYTKPLEVAWLCPGCHGAEHFELREAA